MTIDSVPENTLPPSQDPLPANVAVEPPRTLLGVLSNLGPGLIIAGSIVGSGELVATTKTGAQAGMSLLWLIIIGCVIKIFVQIELGRYAISHGESTLSALNRVPGPRWIVNWLLWYWLVMMVASMGQLGGIVAGVGQSLAISLPITGDYNNAIAVPSQKELEKFVQWQADEESGSKKLMALPEHERFRVVKSQMVLKRVIDGLGERGETLLATARRIVSQRAENKKHLSAKEPLVAVDSITDPFTWDDRIWAIIIGFATAAMLYWGRYNLIQNVSTVLVVAFTFVTVGNVVALQFLPDFALSWRQIFEGLKFHLPEAAPGQNPLQTAMATFGIIGVGATELIAYPYWCLEKGYAKYAGRRDGTPQWAIRARGWISVMGWDSFCSMLVYTTATLAFYLTGVAVLYREGRDPENMRMVSTLAAAYVPIFGEYARWLFLLGAFAVLYSTYLVASAGHARTWIDAFKLIGLIDRDNEAVHQRTLAIVSGIFPLLCLLIFLVYPEPVQLILLSGLMQAIMLPMLAGAALYFRYAHTDRRLLDFGLWDALLAISSLGLLVAGGWTLYSKLLEFF